MGFAVDLGRLYMIRGELRAAAESMALAAAPKLIGTDIALDDATVAARLTLDAAGGYGNKYDYGGISIGETSGTLSSDPGEPAYYETLPGALEDDNSSGNAGGTTARYVGIKITADAPLVFWGLLQQGMERKTPVVVRAVAGLSSPLCTACGIEPIAIAPIDSGDEENFGFEKDSKYTLGYVCNGSPTPGLLADTVRRVPYLLLNRYNEEAQVYTEEATQAFRIGAQGLPPSTSAASACLSISTPELIWTNATPMNCNQNRVSSLVTAFTCGLATRLEPDLLAACENISEAATLVQAYRPDTDVTALDSFSAYIGNTRRVLTVPVVESLTPAGEMIILGFRQFMLEPNQNSTNLNPSDSNGRFTARYIGSVVPVRQGRFDGCTLSYGPGKVVLHQ